MSGVQLAVHQQALAMLKASQARPGMEVELYCGHAATIRCAAELKPANVHFVGGVGSSVGARVAWQQLWLPRELRHRQVDVVHALAYTSPWLSPCPTVVNIHDVIGLDHPELCSRANAWHMRLLLPLSVKNAAAVIVSSSFTADRLMAHTSVSAKRIHCLPLGVDFDFFATAPAGHVQGCSAPPWPYVLFVGNLEPKKGLDVLLAAYERIAEKVPWHLVLAGRAAWRSRGLLRRLRRYRGAGTIHLLGYVPQAQVPELYRRAQVVVMPSRVEGFGLPVLEAMAAGVPVVHSDHPVLLETAGGAGLAFAAGDALALGSALLQVHASPGLVRECVQQGLSRARAMTWQSWADGALDVIARVKA